MTLDRAAELQSPLEPQRHAAELRWFVSLPDHAVRSVYLAGVAKHRGRASAERIRKEAWKILRKAPESGEIIRERKRGNYRYRSAA